MQTTMRPDNEVEIRIVPLSEAGGHLDVGGKAARLGELMRRGEHVPDGFSLIGSGERAVSLALEAYRRMGSDTPVAVRSSASAEDGTDASFAGQFETVLDVRGEEALADAIAVCWESLSGERVAAYVERRGLEGHAAGLTMSVLVQRMVPARAAGVAFSANPLTGARDEVVIHAVRGLGDVLVSGEVDPDRYRMTPRGEVNVERSGAESPPITDDEARQVAALVRRIAAAEGVPQDVERGPAPRSHRGDRAVRGIGGTRDGVAGMHRASGPRMSRGNPTRSADMWRMAVRGRVDTWRHGLHGSSVEASDRYPLVLSPFDIRGRRLRNRIVSTPHATGWSRDGLIDRSEVDYHVRKSAGGCGLVMTFGSASVDRSTEASYGSVALWDERNEPALRALADGVHEHGALVMSQMTHMGRRGTSAISGIPLRAPSDLPEGVHMEVPVPLATDELPAIVERFANAARRLERCGLDGAEVTSFGGHLIEQFFDPRVNTRTDEYGGSLENRTRFAREVLEAVRATVSDTFIVGFRMAVDQCLTGGLGPDDMIEIARSVASTGAVDLFSVSGGTGATRLATAFFVPGDMLPEGVYNERAIRFRQEVGVPTLVAGRNVEPDMAEAVVAAGVELVAMTRALIADPDLPLKIADGRHHRPCVGLNDGCIGRLYTGMPMYCSVNPAIRDPGLAEVVEAGVPVRVVVVGGGVAGLEAARAAALRGHHVVLFERRTVLGGRARLAAQRSGRERWYRYIDWLRDEAEATGAEIWLGVDADADRVLAGKPEVVIVATGSILRPEARLPGPVPVLDVDELLDDGLAVLPDPSSGSALILDDDGHQLAPTASEMLVAAGFEVEIATTHPAVGDLIDATQLPFVLQRLARDGVRLTPNVTGVASSGRAVTLRHLFSEADEQRERIAVVVIAGRRMALCALPDQLAAAAPGLPVVVVGDALSPRTLLDATAEGARAGANIAAPAHVMAS